MTDGSAARGKRVAILQSNYIPWKGYFDIINGVDEFILYDDMQYTRSDWRNRNKIKTPRGLQWLTIPVKIAGWLAAEQKIKDTAISDRGWSRKHWNALVANYGKAPFFRQYKDRFEELYLKCDEEYLSRINYRFLVAVCGILGIGTRLSWSMDYRLAEGKTERIVDLCRQAGAIEYVSGPAAKDYLDAPQFERAGMKLTFADYSGYPEYPQFHPPFEHGVTILDLIFHMGPEASRCMKSFPRAGVAAP